MLEKRKKSLFLIRYFKQNSDKNVKSRALGHSENVNTFCDNLELAMAQLGKNYSPPNIYNLIINFFCKNKKVQIIQRLPCITKLNKEFCINNVVRAFTFHFITNTID